MHGVYVCCSVCMLQMDVSYVSHVDRSSSKEFSALINLFVPSLQAVGDQVKVGQILGRVSHDSPS